MGLVSFPDVITLNRIPTISRGDTGGGGGGVVPTSPPMMSPKSPRSSSTGASAARPEWARQRKTRTDAREEDMV